MAEQWNDDRDFLRDSFWIFHAWKMFVPHGLACVIDDLDFFASGSASKTDDDFLCTKYDNWTKLFIKAHFRLTLFKYWLVLPSTTEGL